jgi:hypothetical protein
MWGCCRRDLERNNIWFVLLLGFTAGLEIHAYPRVHASDQWKAAHPGIDPRSQEGEHKLPDGTYQVSFTPCTYFIESLPVWVIYVR